MTSPGARGASMPGRPRARTGSGGLVLRSERRLAGGGAGRDGSRHGGALEGPVVDIAFKVPGRPELKVQREVHLGPEGAHSKGHAKILHRFVARLSICATDPAAVAGGTPDAPGR